MAAAQNTRTSGGSSMAVRGSDVRTNTAIAMTTNSAAALSLARRVSREPGRISRNGTAIDVAIMPMNKALEYTGCSVTNVSMTPAIEKTAIAIPAATGSSSHQSTRRAASRQSPRVSNKRGTSVRFFADAMRRL